MRGVARTWASFALALGATCLCACGISINYGVSPELRVSAARLQISAFLAAMELYHQDTGAYPSEEAGLEALRHNLDKASRWQGPYLPADIPEDPWNRPYVYRFPAGAVAPTIVCYGSDGKPGGTGAAADIEGAAERR